MIRQLTASPLSGWQEEKEQATDLTQLSASFRIERGQATTTDLNLVGPLVRLTGSRHHRPRHQDAGVPGRAEAGDDHRGPGPQPTIRSGSAFPWSSTARGPQPRIYPDMAGMLDNPDAAYAKLKEMGKGLFGANGGGLGGLMGGLGGNQPSAGSRQFWRRRASPTRSAASSARRSAA